MNVTNKNCILCNNRKITNYKYISFFEQLVEKFMFPECCGDKYRNRIEFEDHRTTPAHLRELYKVSTARRV